MSEKAVSTLEIKSVDEDRRIIRGIASTPAPDRVQDVMVSKGAKFTLPMPLLWQHKQDQPIGHVIEAKITDAGIEVVAQISQVDEDGELKKRLDHAWQSIKAKLVRGLSIGFRGIKAEPIPGSMGLKFLEWDWHELSAVTIPANIQATILSVKSHAQEQGAASGNAMPVVRFAKPAGATAKPSQKSAATGADMTIREMIEAARGQLALKSERMEALVMKGAETGATMAEAEQVEYDGLTGEVKSLQAHIKRLEDLEAVKVADAKPVQVQPAGGVVEVKRFDPVVKAPPLKNGLAVARFARYLGLAKGNVMLAEQMAKQNAQEHPQVVEMVKAAVAAGTTTHSTWANPLIGAGGEQGGFADFVEYLRPLTIVGKFGTSGIPSLRRVPFRVGLVGQTSGGAAYWVGEGAAKPLTKFDFERKHMDPLKIASIAVATEELLRDSSPSADALIRDSLVEAARERMDKDFIDPTKAAAANVSPASITNGVTPITASGTTADALRTDIRTAMAQFFAARNAPTTGVWITDTITALGISLMRNALGTAPEFGGISVNGGTLEGLPVIVSDWVTRDSSGGQLILVNAQDIYFADDGDFAVDLSREASLVMDNAPTMNSTTPTAAQLVSMWQTNSVAFRVERTLNWMKRRTQSVSVIDNTNYGA